MKPDYDKLKNKMVESLKKKINPDMDPEQKATVLKFFDKVQVVSDEECKQADLRLCASRRITADNIEGKCDICGKPIFYDAGFPMGPLCKFVCLDCAITLADDESSLSA